MYGLQLGIGEVGTVAAVLVIPAQAGRALAIAGSNGTGGNIGIGGDSGSG